ncbi:MAG: HEAT repeat domain-containing protein, partial [Planctomycetaceae bacterium]|nr:HEAT repeat domain-containing protein [Planctomycetaceae bacterium]
AVPLLIRAMSDTEPRVRQFAINACGHWKLTDTTVLTALVERLGDLEPRNVVQASTVLAEVGEPAYPVVVAALDVPALTQGAIMTLGRMGPKAAAAAGKLQELTMAKTPGTRIEAMVALTHVAPQSGATTVALLNRLATDDSVDVRHTAVDGLVHLGLSPAVTAALDKAAQQDLSPIVREAASAALGKK